jgi:hypothetical protein
MTLDQAADAFASEVAAGALPSVRQIQTRARTGRPRAQQIQTHLAALMDAGTITPVNALSDAQTRECERIPA